MPKQEADATHWGATNSTSVVTDDPTCGTCANMKRDREEEAADGSVVPHLVELASTVGTESRAAALAAEKRARAALIQKIKAMPPRQCFSSAALTAFKRKHVAMMQREGTAPRPQSRTADGASIPTLQQPGIAPPPHPPP